MQLTLSPEQEAWLNAHVARGDFPSAGEALRRLIDERIAEENDDLGWARPDVEAALAAASRGEVISRAEHRARNAARLAPPGV